MVGMVMGYYQGIDIPDVTAKGSQSFTGLSAGNPGVKKQFYVARLYIRAIAVAS
jgi:hypothetical protein